MNKVYRSITNVFAMSLAICMVFSFSSLASGRLEIRANPGSRVHLYRAGMVDANGKASVYSWYSDVDDVSELSDEELADMISRHFNVRYEDKVGTFRVGSDGSLVFDDIMDAVYYIRSDGMDPAAVILPGTDAQTGELFYDVTVAIGDTALSETEASAVEPETAESEATVETSGTSASPEEQGTNVAEETIIISEPETAAQESASAVQDKPAATENETTVPHTARKLMIAALLMALAVAAVIAIARIRRRRTIEKGRAAREARLRAWKERQAAEEEIEDSNDRV